MRPSPIRVATRYLVALRCFREYSLAWVDPKGKIHEMPGRMTHHDWAGWWLENNDPSFDRWQPKAYDDILMERGWVRATAWNEFQIKARVTDAAMRGAAQVALGCITSFGKDPEDDVTLWTGNRAERMPAGDFIERYGSRQMADQMYERLLAAV